jgi:hypothetical protein
VTRSPPRGAGSRPGANRPGGRVGPGLATTSHSRSPRVTLPAVNEPDQAKRPLRRHRELLAALASGFVGALALATSTYNVYLQRQQVRAQVWPRLVMEANYDIEKNLSLSFTNRGVGPAEVKRVRVLVDGKRAEDWPDAESMLLRKADFQMPVGNSIEDQVLSPGLEIRSFVIRDANDARDIFVQRNRITIELCYCSTLDDCWLDVHRGLFAAPTTQPVAACPPDPKPFHSLSAETMDQLAAKLLVTHEMRADGGPSDAQ